MRILSFTLFRIGWLGLLMLPLPAGHAGENQFNVFVSILPHAYLVERIGGGQVNVFVMVGPGQTAETYEPVPRQMVQLSKSRLYFQTGLPFEEVWLRRIQSLNPQLTLADLREGLTLLPMAGHAHEAEESEAHEKKDEGLLDPHIWLCPIRVQIQARTVAKYLTGIDPGHADGYQKNLAGILTELQALHEEITQKLTGLRSRKFIVYHPAWGYFADTYQLEQIPVEVEGKEPSAKQMAELIATAKANQIKVIFVQPQISRKTAETLAKEIGGRVVAIDPLAKDLVDNLRKAAQALAEALR